MCRLGNNSVLIELELTVNPTFRVVINVENNEKVPTPHAH
jgi:hypothetical protein